MILLFTWMGAEPKHIAKYTSSIYIKFFPTASNHPSPNPFDMILLRSSSLKRRYEPVLAKVLSLSQASKMRHTQSRILIQAFNNGGAYTFLRFSRFYHALAGSAPPVDTLIFDSGPTIGDHAQRCRHHGAHTKKPSCAISGALSAEYRISFSSFCGRGIWYFAGRLSCEGHIWS
jgi:hypothetical protein